MTPLLHAANMGQAAIIEMLLEAHAAPDICDNAGRTPLMLAAAGGMIGVVEKLITARIGDQTVNSAINQQDKINGDTALILAAKHNSAEVVTLLLEARALPEISNKEEFTALKLAKYHKLKAVTPILQNPNRSFNAPGSAQAENEAKILENFRIMQQVEFEKRAAELAERIERMTEEQLAALRADLERRRAELDAELERQMREFEEAARAKLEDDKKQQAITLEKQALKRKEEERIRQEQEREREQRIRDANARLLAEKQKREALAAHARQEEENKISKEYDEKFAALEAKLMAKMQETIDAQKKQNDDIFQQELDARMAARKDQVERENKQELDDYIRTTFPEAYGR